MTTELQRANIAICCHCYARMFDQGKARQSTTNKRVAPPWIFMMITTRYLSAIVSLSVRHHHLEAVADSIRVTKVQWQPHCAPWALYSVTTVISHERQIRPCPSVGTALCLPIPSRDCLNTSTCPAGSRRCAAPRYWSALCTQSNA